MLSKMIGKFHNSVFLFVIIVSQTGLVHSELSDYLSICSAKDPELNNCLMKSAVEFIENIKNGIPEFGIPSIQPLFVPMTEIRDLRMKVHLSFVNMSIYGLDEVNFTRAYAEPENYKLEFEYLLPRQTFLSTYKVDGKIMMLPIVGQGDSNITMLDVNVGWKIYGKSEVRDGTNYMKLTEIKASIEPKEVKINFDNLFNGNKMLGDVMNDVLNTNWKDIYEYVRPTFEEQYGNSIFEAVNSVFSQTPYDQIFKDFQS